MKIKIDAVFEGGGIKGIAFIGSICYLEENGYKWGKCAGTSAGAIIASLLAAGYTGKEIKDIMFKVNYNKFIDKSSKSIISLADKFNNILKKINHISGLIKKKGIYSGDYIQEWMNSLLKKKGKTKFKDVSINGKSRLKIIASDITKKDMLILPDDLIKYGIDPMEFEIAKAVRMSVSIPFYFQPVKLSCENGFSFIVDGGLLSNFPIWIFDVKGIPRWPTFGFKLSGDEISYTAEGKSDIVSFSLDMITTAFNRNEERYIKNNDMIRTISIPTLGVKTTQFDIQKETCLKLFESGYISAKSFLDKWNFHRYIREYRSRDKYLY